MKIFTLSIACVLLTTAGAAHAETDFRGVWQIKGNSVDLLAKAVERPQFTPQGQSRYEQNRLGVSKRDVQVDLTLRCSSPGMPRILQLPYPFEIFQESGYIAFVFEWNQLFRQILLKGERDPYTLPSAMGFSQGTWEGDTLVVTTADRNGTTLLDNTGLPHGMALKLTEHLRLKNGGKVLEDRITIEDGEFYQKPWTVVLEFERQKHTSLQEDACLDRVAAGRPPIETPAERRKARKS